MKVRPPLRSSRPVRAPGFSAPVSKPPTPSPLCTIRLVAQDSLWPSAQATGSQGGPAAGPSTPHPAEDVSETQALGWTGLSLGVEAERGSK